MLLFRLSWMFTTLKGMRTECFHDYLITTHGR
jgi:hypothetical protein